MRYKAEPFAGHQCCFAARVIDTESDDENQTICECYDLFNAEQIAESLNATEAMPPGVRAH